MNYRVEIAIAEKAVHAGPVCQVKREKPEPGAHAELPKPRILELRVVVVVKVVYTHNLEPIREKAVDEVSAYETSGASDQNPSAWPAASRVAAMLPCLTPRLRPAEFEDSARSPGPRASEGGIASCRTELAATTRRVRDWCSEDGIGFRLRR